MGYTPPWIHTIRSATATYLYGGLNTGDDLRLIANPTDTMPLIILNGAGALEIYNTSGQTIKFYQDGTNNTLMLSYSTPDVIFTTLTDKNIYLKTQGTGVVKFGTYTAGASTDSTGYITILDAAGNTRKLMVQA